MRLNLVVRYVSFVLLISSIFMFISAGVSLIDGIGSDFFPLLLSALITLTVGVFPFIFVPSNPNLTTSEVNLFVVLAWFVSCVFGTLPYILWGGEFTVPNAWFESVSGFTTTGATILQDIENIPKGLLFWRSSTHFIGGVGVVMFAILVLQSQRTIRKRLTQAEVSDLASYNFKFKPHQLVKVILTVYIGITIVLTAILVVLGMSLFDAVNHAFSTVATGGFSTKNASIASYDGYAIGIVLIVFMIISGMHFGMIYSAVTGRSKAILRSPVIRFYLATIAAGIIVITASVLINGNYSNFFEALYQSTFQVAANITTTGFATADSSVWHPIAICVLMFFALQCACAGSTSGGIKTDRVFILWRSIAAQIKMRQYPNAVIPIRTKYYKIEEHVVASAMTYIALYFLVILFAMAILSLFNIDLLSSLSISISFMGNVGPAFGDFNSLGNYSALPDLVKLSYPFLMLLGRLECYGLFVIFVRNKYH